MKIAHLMAMFSAISLVVTLQTVTLNYVLQIEHRLTVLETQTQRKTLERGVTFGKTSACKGQRYTTRPMASLQANAAGRAHLTPDSYGFSPASTCPQTGLGFSSIHKTKTNSALV